MDWLSWVIFGLLAGAVAKMLMPGRDPGGCILTILLGIAGSVVGGLIGAQFHWGRVRGFDIRSFGLAVLGSLALLIVYRIIAGRSE
ncbi:MAG TPA: GlsB/YeaQ/YmgE family stress response membrane protein [Blastocatellia bacterium]|nr:GlsB/YeaQ/YmgE family stress response membrane protein [Blastocatellia bacterium]